MLQQEAVKQFLFNEVTKMEISNEYIEALFLEQMKNLTIKTNRQLRSFDLQLNGKR